MLEARGFEFEVVDTRRERFGIIMTKLDSKVPEGPLHQKWDNRKAEYNLVAPNNKKKKTIIVVGT
ncbi:MAG: hypothetical protein ACOC9J_03500, partial [Persicimonas sp.]